MPNVATHTRRARTAADVAAHSVIRAPEFGKRLSQAADLLHECPPKNYGRLPWIQERLKAIGQEVSQESIRKWLDGIVTPRSTMIKPLARIFQVDAAWLSHGEGERVSTVDHKARDATASGVVNVVAGFIQMDGGNIAFPPEDDRQAQDRHVHMYSIIRGANYALHITPGEAKDRHVTFFVPVVRDNLIVLGVVRDGFAVDIFEITDELIESEGKRSQGAIEVSVDGSKLRRVDSFTKRL